MSSRVLVPLVTLMVRAPQVLHAGDADGEGVAGSVTVDGGVSDVGGDVGAGSGCRSARGRSLACLLVLAVFVAFWSCRISVAPRGSWRRAPRVMLLVGVLQVMQWCPW